MSTIRFLTILAITLISMQSVLAHFTLTYPSSRGFAEDKEAQGPCGGFDTVSSQRVQMPLKSSFIEINSGHISYTYVMNAVAGNNPVAADFAGTSNVQVAQGGRAYPQAACLPLTFNDNLKANTNITIQIVYNGGDGLLYQCVDAVLVDSAPGFNSSQCVNADGSSTSITPSASASGSASTPASSNKTNQGTSIHVATGLTFIVAAGISLLLA